MSRGNEHGKLQVLYFAVYGGVEFLAFTKMVCSSTLSWPESPSHGESN
jgi:hypothetical protein